jgi:pyruvate dehydrogenase E2 component (dihydrolipoamide acetyltransferase)
MVKEVVMPKLGMTMKEGVVSTWYKHVGDPIKKGEPIASIHSEKIEMDLEAPDDGEILKIEVEENKEVPPGTVICYIGEHGEKISVSVPSVDNPGAEALTASEVNDNSVNGAINMERNSSVKISPVARKMALQAGLDLHSIIGTGPGGRITKDDVERVLKNKPKANDENTAGVETGTTPAANSGVLAETTMEASVSQEQKSEPFSVNPEMVHEENQKVVPVTGIRKVIATRMLKSVQNTAQVTLFSKADVTELKALKQQLSPSLQNFFEEKLTFTDFVARAVVLSLLEHKQMNCSMIENEIHMNHHVHLGIAVALEKGLVVPVIREAEKCSIKILSQAIKSLSKRARNGELRSDEMQGSTFSITNLGTFGVEYFTPILNPPETGILGIGSIKDEPVFVGEELKRRSLLPLSLTFDHRVLDGAPAAAFLHSVKEYLEKPLSLLL